MDFTEAECWSENFSGELFVDVGANIGRYTLRLANQFARVIAMEPWPATFMDLARSVKEARLTNVELLMIGASDRSRVERMWEYKCGENNSVESSHPVSHEHSSRCEDVVLQRLDEIIDGRRVSFIKIDTEGHDVEALRGAMSVIKRDHPRTQVEYHRKEDAQKIIDLLREAGLETHHVRTPKSSVGWILGSPAVL